MRQQMFPFYLLSLKESNIDYVLYMVLAYKNYSNEEKCF